jgi:UDP-glucose 4-epimerase
MKVLITGGSGFIGRNLVEYLGSRYSIAAPNSRELDLLDDAAVRAYLRAGQFDVVVHTATTRSNRRMGAAPDLLDRNCRMFFNLARNRSDFGKMLHFGSGAEYSRAELPARVSESYFDTHVPTDPYGFSKYICSKYAETTDNIWVLRLFGVFGRYEAWDVRFISNACARVVKGLPIVIRQNVRFDYLYASELAELLAWFLEHEPAHKTYNVCRGETHTLHELAAMVATASGRNPEIVVRNPAMGPEYSADNTRMLDELGSFRFREMSDCVRELYDWYQAHAAILDEKQLSFDESPGEPLKTNNKETSAGRA